MHTLKISLLLTFLIGQVKPAQADSISYEKISRTTINYKEFVTVDTKLFAINDSGRIVIWDLTNLDTIHFAHNDTSFQYTAIAVDRHNQIVVGTSNGNIYKINAADLSFSLFMRSKYYPVYSICFNSDNKLFLIIPYAVYAPLVNKTWTKFENHASGIIHRKKVMGLFWKRIDHYFTLPDFTYLDKYDRWWICKSYGEFGGEIQIFDTKNEKIYDNKFDKINTGQLYPKSVFNDNDGNTYITSGLHHLMNSGEIYKIAPDRRVSIIFDEFNRKVIQDTTMKVEKGKKGVFTVIAKKPPLPEAPFVGPGIFNRSDTCIYFATDEGFYKAALPKDGKIVNAELLLCPTLSWKREPIAIGRGMTIKRIEFLADNKLLFLTANDGFGIYSENRLIMLK